jgi:hypothetical protein
MTTETNTIDHTSLQWGLDRLSLWGELDGEESADPRVRGEAAYSAKITIEELASEVRSLQTVEN